MDTVKPKKMVPGSMAWDAAATELALCHAPAVGACYACKQPCLGGHCCSYCGAGEGCYDPSSGERLR